MLTATLLAFVFASSPCDETVVSDVPSLRAAIVMAMPGSTITLAQGTYTLDSPLVVTKAGTAGAPITVRGILTAQTTIQTNGSEEAFLVQAPYWIFEGLDVEVSGGACGSGGSCHGYKLDGAKSTGGTAGSDIVIRDGACTLAATAESCIKGSAAGFAPYPDNVTIENLAVSFSSPSSYVVTEGIDLVGGKGWTIRNSTFIGVKNLNGISFALVLKGNAQNSLIEGNYFLDSNIAISVGGTSSSQYYRDGDSTYEHRDAIVRNNVVKNTTDVAMYLEKATRTDIYNNTIINPFSSCGPTGCSAIDVRYASSSNNTIRNNILAKRVNLREGGTATTRNNIEAYNIAELESDFSQALGSSLDLATRDKGESIPELAIDFYGTKRPVGGGIDIGAVELRVVVIADAGVNPDATAPDATPVDSGLCPCLPSADAGVKDASAPDAIIIVDASAQDASAPDASAPDAPSAPDAMTALDASAPPDGAVTLIFPRRTLIREDEIEHGLPGMYYGAMGTADFDQDGWTDVVMTGNYDRIFDSSDGLGGSDKVRLFRNVSMNLSGPIKFMEKTGPSLTGVRGSQVVVGDFNGDGKPDYAVQFRNGSKTTAFLNQGNWTFTAVQVASCEVQSSGIGIASGDIDKDGKADLAFISSGYGSCPGLWYTLAGSTWIAHQTDFSHEITYGGTLVLGDVNGDGWLDIAFGGNASAAIGTHQCSSLMQGPIFLGSAIGFSKDPFAIPGHYGMRIAASDRPTITCDGSDNAQYRFADLDGDGHQDMIVAGSATAINGPPGMNGQQYDFAVLFNVDGTGNHFVPWEATGIQDPNGGTSNGGPGNLDMPNSIVGDFNGDGLLDVFVEGHHRDYKLKPTNPYIFESVLFTNNGDRTFTRVQLPLRQTMKMMTGSGAIVDGTTLVNEHVGEGGSAAADFNKDGSVDLLFSGAVYPFHSNGSNFKDLNSPSSLRAYIFR